MENIWIIVPVFNRVNCIYNFLENLQNQKYPAYKVIIIDHGTNKIDFSAFDDSEITVLRESPALWWTGAINTGLRKIIPIAKIDDFVLIINDDVEFEKIYLEKLVQLSVDYPRSIIGSACINTDRKRKVYIGNILHKAKAKFCSSMNENNDKKKKVYECDTLSGRGMFIPIKIIKEIGLLNEKKLPHYGADNEYSFRAKKNGFNLLCSTECVVYTKDNEKDPIEKESFIKFITNKKKPGNLKSIIQFSLLCFPIYYSPYYIFINFCRLFISFGKHRLRE